MSIQEKTVILVRETTHLFPFKQCAMCIYFGFETQLCHNLFISAASFKQYFNLKKKGLQNYSQNSIEKHQRNVRTEVKQVQSNTHQTYIRRTSFMQTMNIQVQHQYTINSIKYTINSIDWRRLKRKKRAMEILQCHWRRLKRFSVMKFRGKHLLVEIE